MEKISIRTKFLFIILGSFLSLGIITLIFTYISLSYHFKKELKSWSIPLAQKISEEVKPILISGDKIAAKTILLKYLQKEPEIAYLIIIDKFGNIFAHTFEKTIPFELENISLKNLYGIKEVNIEGRLIFNIAYPLKKWTLHIGLLRLTKLPIKQRVYHVFKIVGSIFGAVSLVGIGIAFILSYLVTKPIFNLVQAAEAFGRGELDVKADVKTKDEVRELANAFNKMAKDLKISQERIKRLLAEFTQIYNNAPSPMRVIDKDFNIISQNEAMNELVGVSAEKAKGKKCYELLRSPAVCQTKDCSMKLIFQGIKRIDREQERITPEGKIIPCRQMATPFRDATGNIIGIIEIYTDISERKQFIEKLENERKRLSELLNIQKAFADILTSLASTAKLKPLLKSVLEKIIYYTDSQLGVIYILENEHLKPYAASALDLKKIKTFKMGDGLPGRCAIERKQIIVSDIPKDYFKISSGSGERLPNHIICFPIFYKDKLMGVLELGTLHTFSEKDISFLKIVAEQLGIGIDHALAYEKVEKLSQELQEKNELLVAQNEELQSQSEELSALNEELQAQAEELAAQKKALEEKTKQVEEVNRLKSEFLSNMSHELRTPLNAILGMAKLLQEKIEDKTQKQYVEIIERNGQSLLALINDVLDLSKIEAGRVEVIWEKIYLKEFIESIIASVKPLADEKKLPLKTSFDESIDFIVTDPEKLKRILFNLLSNAIKFTDKGEVAVEVKAEKEKILISVKDTGIGIPEEALDYIFEAFRQVDGSTTRRYGGTGLGLNIAKKLAELLGGEIKVKSKVGVGSTFTVILPKQPIEKKKEEVLKQKIKSVLLREKSFGVKKVLIIDDDPVVIKELSIILKDEPYQTIFASNGKEGLDCIKKEVPDLILLDLKMPVMDGFALLEVLERDKRFKDIPVIILSALDLTKEEKERLKGNIKGILLKGFIDKTTFIETIKKILYGEKHERISPKILIVEDNPDNLFLLKEVFKNTDYEIYTAENGLEAIEKALEIRPNLILMDMLMPLMDGYEATHKIRNIPALKDIPIIALTAKAMKGNREEILAIGCNDYITKPFDFHELFKKVEKWLKV